VRDVSEPREDGTALRQATSHKVLLPEEIEHSRVFGMTLEFDLQQAGVARVFGARHIDLGVVAVVNDAHGGHDEAAAVARIREIDQVLMDRANEPQLRAPREHPRNGVPNPVVTRAVDAAVLDHHGVADYVLWQFRGECMQQRPTERIELLIRVEHEYPVGGGSVDRRVACGGEVVAPDKLYDAGTMFAGNLARAIGRASVEDEQFVDERPGAIKALADELFLVAGDDTQRERERVAPGVGASRMRRSGLFWHVRYLRPGSDDRRCVASANDVGQDPQRRSGHG
jgi:hypothetical protein